ncbi:LemA family protein [Phenylobacterium sp.]|uniref:LemA family protein n=1 Tax=Phenylobacterium sp. TaxID=1871053 RepID=UPI0025D2477A|nr:LemA family protein [Phenylobacterium sp.]
MTRIQTRSLSTRLARIALILLAPLIIAGCGVNTIPTKEEAAKAKWAEVQNQYQRRSDLIPNLVNTVKGYAAQEKSTLVEVTEARASATQVKVDASTITNPAQFQQFQQAQDKLSGVLGRLMMIQEKYPDLKSNENFLALQSQLEGTENRIAISRRDYNDSVQDFNTTLRTFPQVLWAKSVYSSSKPMVLFSATQSAQTAPTVSFDTTPPPPPAGVTPGSPPPAAPAPASK